MRLSECPRDAIQGIKKFIPTKKKIDYLNFLLAANCFEVLDFGSFVSPKAMPQMADTKEVVKGLNLENSDTKLLAIIANERGAKDAVAFEKIHYLGYPFSVSETFQLRNTNATIEESYERVEQIKKIADSKELLVYLSMGFGNPYDDPWSVELLIETTKRISEMGVSHFSLSDTVGIASPKQIEEVYKALTTEFPELQFSAHLHSVYEDWKPKIEAAEIAGCSWLEGAMLGYGGCPMAQDELVGNMPMEKLLRYFDKANSQQIATFKQKFSTLIL